MGGIETSAFCLQSSEAYKGLSRCQTVAGAGVKTDAVRLMPSQWGCWGQEGLINHIAACVQESWHGAHLVQNAVCFSVYRTCFELHIIDMEVMARSFMPL